MTDRTKPEIFVPPSGAIETSELFDQILAGLGLVRSGGRAYLPSATRQAQMLCEAAEKIPAEEDRYQLLERAKMLEQMSAEQKLAREEAIARVAEYRASVGELQEGPERSALLHAAAELENALRRPLGSGASCETLIGEMRRLKGQADRISDDDSIQALNLRHRADRLEHIVSQVVNRDVLQEWARQLRDAGEKHPEGETRAALLEEASRLEMKSEGGCDLGHVAHVCWRVAVEKLEQGALLWFVHERGKGWLHQPAGFSQWECRDEEGGEFQRSTAAKEIVFDSRFVWAANAVSGDGGPANAVSGDGGLASEKLQEFTEYIDSKCADFDEEESSFERRKESLTEDEKKLHDAADIRATLMRQTRWALAEISHRVLSRAASGIKRKQGRPPNDWSEEDAAVKAFALHEVFGTTEDYAKRLVAEKEKRKRKGGITAARAYIEGNLLSSSVNDLELAEKYKIEKEAIRQMFGPST
ncbi:MAG: hypothetical protein R3D51_19515 [Hyphomicrobiaceae bacterium]